MNEATPPWRTFSSDAPAQDAAQPEAAEPRRTVPRWLVPLLAGLGGIGTGVALIGVLVLASGVFPGGGEQAPPPQALSAFPGLDLRAEAEDAPTELVVDVAGAVARPGLHRLRPGDRVGDAIEAAGGFAPRADLAASSRSLNLAQPLEDGAKVLVPELGIDRAAGAGAGAADEDGRIDLNRASQSELESLPGIGPVTASKIIGAREDERFGTVRDLRSRGLVGESVYEDIKGLVHAT